MRRGVTKYSPPNAWSDEAPLGLRHKGGCRAGIKDRQQCIRRRRRMRREEEAAERRTMSESATENRDMKDETRHHLRRTRV